MDRTSHGHRERAAGHAVRGLGLLFNARSIPATILETAIYDDTLIKTPQGWRFKKRVVWRDDDDITPFKPKPLPEAGESK
jgi:hypothetical protein